MSTTTIQQLNPEQLAELLRRSGFRATVVVETGRTVIQSAAQGLGFLLVPGNPALEPASACVDFSFNCLIRLEQALPATLVSTWNDHKRFGRCFQREGMLVLALDVILVGGVSDAWLLAQCELWDRLLHDFIAHLRQPSPTATASSSS